MSGYPGCEPDRPLPTIEASLSGATHGVGDVRIIHAPGTTFAYSGGGYTLLQLLVEELTRQKFADYMQAEVLNPLGMTHSGFEWRADFRDTVALLYGEDGEVVPNYLFREEAAAGLYASAADLAVFVAAGLAGPGGETPGRGVLSEASVELMFTPAAATEGAYGLGFRTLTLSKGARVITHSGSNRGWKSLFAAVPGVGEGLVVLTNSDNGGAFIASVVSSWASHVGQAHGISDLPSAVS